MLDLLFEGQALWFSVPALIGTGVFLLLLVMMLVGGDGGGGFDTDSGGSLDGGDSSSAFQILSVQGVAGFLMGFGWTGVGCSLGAGWGTAVSFGAGTLGGFAMVWILAAALSAMRGLESSGNIPLEETIGKTGEVYSNVPSKGAGSGRVRLVVSGRQRIYNAVSEGAPLNTHSRVTVLHVNDDSSLTVGPE
ncbi:MAG: hypothetical protein ACI9F9_000705 [Candidatus Paceibacteria bacterium]|jgi:membrane protein implicated in regulation of membrane protease activity